MQRNLPECGTDCECMGMRQGWRGWNEDRGKDKNADGVFTGRNGAGVVCTFSDKRQTGFFGE